MFHGLASFVGFLLVIMYTHKHTFLSSVFTPLCLLEQARFVSLMVEDKTKHGTSYVDELCNLHHKIQSRLG